MAKGVKGSVFLTVKTHQTIPENAPLSPLKSIKFYHFLKKPGSASVGSLYVHWWHEPQLSSKASILCA